MVTARRPRYTVADCSSTRRRAGLRARARARVLPLAPSGSGRTSASVGGGGRDDDSGEFCNFVPLRRLRRESSSAHRVPFVFHSAWIGGGPPTNGAPTAAMADDCRRRGVYTFPITIITPPPYAMPVIAVVCVCVVCVPRVFCVCVRPVGLRRPSRERYCYYTRIIAIALFYIYTAKRARIAHITHSIDPSTRPYYYIIILLL